MSTTLTISEANYSGTFSVNAASCFNVALVNQTAPNTIVIVSLAAGTCAFTVSDQQNQSTMATIGTLSKSLTGVLTEFPAGPGSGPFSIVTGPDGNLWFTEPAVDKIGTMTPNGTLIAEFPTSAGAGLRTIRVGPDGNLWFTERTLSRIGRITTKGGLTEFPLAGGSNPSGITAGPDGGIWFSEGGTNNMARMSTTGILNGELSVGANSGIAGVAVGPDGNIWYAAMGSPGLRPSENGRLTTSGTLTKFPLAAGTRGNIAIAPASDGNLWFTEYCGNRIGVMTTNGSPTEYAINGSVPATNCLAPTVADRLPNGIVQGPDGNIWFAESNTNKIGVASRSGSILGEIGTTGTSGPTHITLGPDGAIWFTEQSTNKIGRIQ